MLTIYQTFFFLVLTLLIFTKVQEVDTITLVETRRQLVKGGTSTEIVHTAPDTMLLTTIAWQQCNKDPVIQLNSTQLQLNCRLEILILTIFNSEIDYLVPTEGIQMRLQVNNHSLALPLGSRIPITTKDRKNLTSNTKATLWSSTIVPAESSRLWLQLFIPLAVKPH